MTARVGVAKRRRMSRLIGAFFLLGVLAAVAIALLKPLSETIKELTLPLQHEDVIRQQAQEKNLDPALVAAVIYAESKFRARTSKAGAIGLMQLLPETAKFIAHKSGGSKFQLDDLDSPQINIAYGTWYLRYLIDRYGGQKVLALAAYNGGESNVDRWLADVHAKGEDLTNPEQIPFNETRAYVRRVLDARGQYRRKYPAELGYRRK